MPREISAARLTPSLLASASQRLRRPFSRLTEITFTPRPRFCLTRQSAAGSLPPPDGLPRVMFGFFPGAAVPQCSQSPVPNMRESCPLSSFLSG